MRGDLLLDSKGEIEMKRTLILVSALLVLLLIQENALAETNCLGQATTGNPYSCFGNGNCVWWAWKMAKDNWGDPLRKWGDAKYWADGARAAGYKVDTTPKVNDLAVNTY